MRFFQRCRTFWQQKGGFGMIEAAITLPLFLTITFGVMEFGNMYLQRYAVRDVSDAVKDYLQADPAATTTEMTTFLNALGVGLKGTGQGEENRIITKIRIASNKTIYTTAQFDALCASSTEVSFPIPNPWTSDADPANDNSQYFIHICYPYTYKAITPLPGLTAGVIPTTKVLNGKAVAIINAGNTPPATPTTCVAGTVNWWLDPRGDGFSCGPASYGALTEGGSQNLTAVTVYGSGSTYLGTLTVTCTNGAIVQSNPTCTLVTGGGGGGGGGGNPSPVKTWHNITSSTYVDTALGTSSAPVTLNVSVQSGYLWHKVVGGITQAYSNYRFADCENYCKNTNNTPACWSAYSYVNHNPLHVVYYKQSSVDAICAAAAGSGATATGQCRDSAGGQGPLISNNQTEGSRLAAFCQVGSGDLGKKQIYQIECEK